MKATVVGTLKARLGEGEGYVRMAPVFATLDPLLRADVLKDVIYELQKQYDEALVDNRKAMRAARAKTRG